MGGWMDGPTVGWMNTIITHISEIFLDVAGSL